VSRDPRAIAPARALPSGRHGLPAEYVAANQRARLLRAVGEVCAARGWVEATVAEIVRAAGVSPRTFYRHFASKEQCFVAAYQQAVEEIEATVLAAARAQARGEQGDRAVARRRGGSGDWRVRVGVGLRALLEELRAHPALARMLFVDALFVGGEALACRERTLARLRARLPTPAGAPPEVAEAALGGVVETIYHVVLEGGAHELPGMWEELLYCLLVPLLGHERTLAASAEAADIADG